MATHADRRTIAIGWSYKNFSSRADGRTHMLCAPDCAICRARRLVLWPWWNNFDIKQSNKFISHIISKALLLCLWILIYTIFRAFLYHNYMPEKATGPQFRIRGLILLTWTQIISVTCAFDVTRIWTLASYDAKSVDKKLMHCRYAILYLKQNICDL